MNVCFHEGIGVNSKGEIEFCYDRDKVDDVLMLTKNTSLQVDENGVKYYYAYQFNPNVRDSRRKVVRDYIKTNNGQGYAVLNNDLSYVIENGVLQFNDVFDLTQFDVLLSIESTSNTKCVVNEIGDYLRSYMKPSKSWIDFELVKQTYRHVDFNDKLALKTLIEYGYSVDEAQKEVEFTQKKFEDLKQSGELFQIKRFIPPIIRNSFTNFLTFKNETEKHIYEQLQGANVLIYDDFVTSGNTIKEIVRYLNSINPSNTLTVFVLIKQ